MAMRIALALLLYRGASADTEVARGERLQLHDGRGAVRGVRLFVQPRESLAHLVGCELTRATAAQGPGDGGKIEEVLMHQILDLLIQRAREELRHTA